MVTYSIFDFIILFSVGGVLMSHNPNTVKSQHELTNEGGRKSDVLVEAISKLETTTAENRELEFKIMALESELKAVCDVLIKVSPQHKDWVMSNWKYLYEVNK